MLKWFFKLKIKELAEFFDEYREILIVVLGYLLCAGIGVIISWHYDKSTILIKVSRGVALGMLGGLVIILLCLLFNKIVCIIKDNWQKAKVIKSQTRCNYCDSTDISIHLISSSWVGVKCNKCGKTRERSI